MGEPAGKGTRKGRKSMLQGPGIGNCTGFKALGEHPRRHRDLKEPSMVTWCLWNPGTHSREHMDIWTELLLMASYLGMDSLRTVTRLSKYPCCILIRTLGQRQKQTRGSASQNICTRHIHLWLQRPKAGALRSRRLRSRPFS